MLLAHRRQREADPPSGLAARRKPHRKPRPGGVPRRDPRNRVGMHRPWKDWRTTLPRTDFASGRPGRILFRFARAAAWSCGECRRAGAATSLGTTYREL